MSKLERLLGLARLKQSGKPMTVREMSEICGVSQRTLYRYLNTLSNLDPMITLGQPPSAHPQGGGGELSAEEIVLLHYALESNPLIRYRYFAERFRDIGQKLGLDRKQKPTSTRYVFKTDRTAKATAKANGLVERFDRAIAQGRSIRVKFRGRKAQFKTVWPCGISFRGSQVRLLIAENEAGQPRECRIDRITSLVVNRATTTDLGRRRNRKKG